MDNLILNELMEIKKALLDIRNNQEPERIIIFHSKEELLEQINSARRTVGLGVIPNLDKQE